MIVEGQVHGGVAQGVGQALLEDAVYDKTGQLMTGSYMDYAMPRADDLPSFKVGTTVTVPVQPARHQGLRRGRRDRRAGRGDQRDHRRARHRGDRHAGDARRRVWARLQRTRQRRARRRQEKHGEVPCTLHLSTARPACVRRRNLLGKLEDAKLLAGGQTLLPTMKQRLASPANIIDLGAVEGTVRHRDQGPLDRDRRDDQARRSREFRRSCRKTSRRSPTGRHDRRSGGAPPRHHRRLDRQQRSERGLSGGGARRSARPSSPPSASIAADEFFKGLFETALEPDEIIAKVEFPVAKKAGYYKFRNQASRFALVGVFVAKRGVGNPRRGDRRRLAACSACRHSKRH